MKSLSKILLVFLLLLGTMLLVYQPVQMSKQAQTAQPLPTDLMNLDKQEAATIFNSRQALNDEQTKTLLEILARNGKAEKDAEDAKNACEKSYKIIKEERDKRAAAQQATDDEKKKSDKKANILIVATLIFGSIILYSRLKEDESVGWKKTAVIVEFFAAAFYLLLDRIMLFLGM